MKRTRKWAFVAQEARRLASLGLTPVEIGSRLGVRRETVHRWMANGKLTDTRRGARPLRAGVRSSVAVSPEHWAAAVRRDYALDATDEQLVAMAEQALTTAYDPKESAAIRMQAMRTFQGLVKQLALVARSADLTGKPEASTTPDRPVRDVRRPVGDPRALLTAVK